jgi:hypothetical protein
MLPSPLAKPSPESSWPNRSLGASRPQSLAALQAQLAKLEAENRALERDAERFRKRQKLQRQLDDIRKKVKGMGLCSVSMCRCLPAPEEQPQVWRVVAHSHEMMQVSWFRQRALR